MEADLELLGKFHGHVGPYLILGYKMGLIANRMLGEGAFEKKAHIFTGTKPPVSCLIDGIQLASGCTLGKGNITVEDKGEAKASFTNKGGQSIEISLASGLAEKIEKSFKMDDPDEFCNWVWNATEKQLFVFRNEP